MAEAPVETAPDAGELEAPVVLRRRLDDSVDMDITPMIDIVFLLLIFFLVCSTAAMQEAVQLPPARHGKGVNEQNSVVFSIQSSGGRGPATVISEQTGRPLPTDPEGRAQGIVSETEDGVAGGKTGVIIKAARDVKHRDVARVAAAVGQVEGVKVYWAVLEAD